MRILHVPYVCPPTPNVADGITNVVRNVTQELAKRGHEVEVYTSDMLDQRGNGSLKTKKQVINGVTVYYLRSLWRHKTFIVTPSIIPLLSKRLGNFDIIHIHDCRSFQGIFAYLFARAKNIPYVFQPHGSYSFSLSDSTSKTVAKITLDKLVSGKIIQNASKIIALSQVEAEEYKCAGVPADKIAIVPNGIDLLEYSDLPSKGAFKKKFGLDKNDKIVLYLGRIHKTKGIDLLVKAYAYLTKKMDCKDAVLVMAGPDDGYLDELRSLVCSLGLNRKVLFTGMLSEEDKIGAYVDCAICAYLNPHEPFGLVPLEAAASGRPVVVVRGTPMSEIVNQGNFGFSTGHLDVAALAKIFEKILQDEALATEMGKRGRDYVFAEFDWSKIIVELVKLYKEVAKGNQKCSRKLDT
ncbi:MAG: glycosyltransferase family 4 protein [Candidatus Bathyarchaeia archaeon]